MSWVWPYLVILFLKRDLLSFNHRIYLNKKNDRSLTIFINGVKDLIVKWYAFVLQSSHPKKGALCIVSRNGLAMNAYWVHCAWLIHDKILGINEREYIANCAISSIDISKIKNTCNIRISCKIISAIMIYIRFL